MRRTSLVVATLLLLALPACGGGAPQAASTTTPGAAITTQTTTSVPIPPVAPAPTAPGASTIPASDASQSAPRPAPVVAARTTAPSPAAPGCPPAPTAAITSAPLTPHRSGNVVFWAGAVRGTITNPGPALATAAANFEVTFTPPAGAPAPSPQSTDGTTSDGTVPAHAKARWSTRIQVESTTAPKLSITGVLWFYDDPALTNCSHLGQ